MQLAQSAGFSIAEIKALQESHTKGPGPAGLWKPFAEAKQAHIDDQIDRLRRMNQILTELMNCRCATLQECVELAETRFCASGSNDAQY